MMLKVNYAKYLKKLLKINENNKEGIIVSN